MTLNEDKIRKYLPDFLSDTDIRVFGSIDSTNSYAKGEFDGSPLIVLADSQTNGRGRLGRSFFSPAGTGLYMSIALKLPVPTDSLTVVTAVAVSRAIEDISDKIAQIKWVNDIFADGKKVCGILCEALSCKDGAPESAVIGIGINLSTESFPEEISHIAGSLGDRDFDRNALAAGIYAELVYLLGRDKASVLREYEDRLFILGKEISFTKDGTSRKGVAFGINEDANLLVDSDGEVFALSSGEISLVSENYVK